MLLHRTLIQLEQDRIRLPFQNEGIQSSSQSIIYVCNYAVNVYYAEAFPQEPFPTQIR